MTWWQWAAVAVLGYVLIDRIDDADRKAREAMNVAQATAVKLEELRQECEPE